MLRRARYPAWMLVATGVGIAWREAWPVAAAGALGLGLEVVTVRGWRVGPGRIAVANLVTLTRLVAIVLLSVLAPPVASFWLSAAVLLLLGLDGVDGRVARARGEVTAFGASLDMETDALGVMTLSLLLWRADAAGAWVLSCGLWRYLYALVVAVVPSLGECPPSPLYRWLFVVLMLGLAAGFLPWPALARASAGLATVVVSASFVHSLLRSRGVREIVSGRRRPSETPASGDRR